jgi:hypothetical protein
VAKHERVAVVLTLAALAVAIWKAARADWLAVVVGFAYTGLLGFL